VTAAAASVAVAEDLTPLEQLGKHLFFDRNLSSPAGQACASCHSPETGFTGPDSRVNDKSGIYRGAAPGAVGNRKPPSVAYASYSPPRKFLAEEKAWVGGQFWDGRANDLVEQAKGPFLNPLEMNNPSSGAVVDKVRQGRYRELFQAVQQDLGVAEDDDSAFDLIARAIAAYESSSEVNAFSSKYDLHLAGKVELSAAEKRGLNLFAGKANCATCHPHLPAADGTPPLFTTFRYENVGTPRNEFNPFYLTDSAVNPDGRQYQDKGLGVVTGDPLQDGKVKIPTLRNVARRPDRHFVKAYLHNGMFKSIKNVIGFYNLRDKSHDKYLAPDVEANVNRMDLGDLGLSDAEEEDLVAFLETLSDGYDVPDSASGPPSPEVVRRPADVVPPQTVEVDPGPSAGIVPAAAVTQPQSARSGEPAVPPDRFRVARDWARVERFRRARRP